MLNILIDKLKHSDLEIISYDRSTRYAWDCKVSLFNFYGFFNSLVLEYESEYFEASICSFYAIYEDKLCVFKYYLKSDIIYLFPVCFQDGFDFFKGILISKAISSLIKDSKYKPSFENLPITGNLENHFKLQIGVLGSLKPCLEMFVDLKPSVEDLWRGIRKSYKSLINKGERKFSIESDFSNDIWTKCKRFHFEISGRITRNDKTWEIQKQMILEKRARLFFIIQEKKLLGFAFFTESTCFANYGVGVYDRDKFNSISISHVIIWHAIKFYKSRNFKKIYLGPYTPENHLYDNKLKNINDFKLGFTNSLVSNNYIT